MEFRKIPIILKTDCKSLLENITTSSLVANKRLRIDIAALKEMMERKDIQENEWIPSKDQVADRLTKALNNSAAIINYVSGK